MSPMEKWNQTDNWLKYISLLNVVDLSVEKWNQAKKIQSTILSFLQQLIDLSMKNQTINQLFYHFYSKISLLLVIQWYLRQKYLWQSCHGKSTKNQFFGSTVD